MHKTKSDINYNKELADSFTKFIQVYLDHGLSHQIGGPKNGMDDVHDSNFKDLTSLIDYECNFKDGICKNERNKPKVYGKISPKCCCQGCNNTIGYLSYIPSLGIAKEIWKLYTPTNGFWSTKGCKLPRKYRSSTCLTHYCRADFSEAVFELFGILRYGLEEIDEYYLKYIGDTERGCYGSHPKSEEVYEHLKLRLHYEKKVRESKGIKMNEFEQVKFGWS